MKLLAALVGLALLAGIFAVLVQLLQQGKKTMSALSDLQAQVAQNTAVEASAAALIQGLKAQLDAAIASGDPAQLQALSAELATSGSALAAAVAANTPAAPVAPAAPATPAA